MAGNLSQYLGAVTPAACAIDGATLTTPAAPNASATSENQTPFIILSTLIRPLCCPIS